MSSNPDFEKRRRGGEETLKSAVDGGKIAERAFAMLEQLYAEGMPADEQVAALTVALALTLVNHKLPGRSVAELEAFACEKLKDSIQLMHRAMEGASPSR